MSFLEGVIAGLGLFLVVVTVLPFVPTSKAWVRVWDFPRLQIGVLLLGVLATGCLFLPLQQSTVLAFLAAAAASLGFQLWRIWPYTPLHAVQAEATPACDRDRSLTLLAANVLISNRQADRLIDLVRRTEPDIVLLLETDEWWENELRALSDDYPHVLRRPQDNAYGIHLSSKLKLVDPQIRFLVCDDLPSIKTGVRLRSGEEIVLYGTHPRPPPRADTAQRDAELVMIGQEIRRTGEPAIVAGDLNDVAWSRTTDLFQEVSRLLDPRIGRGLYATFNARWPFLRWPLDHIFFSSDFTLRHLSVQPSIGSDHFPLLVGLCYRPRIANRHATPDGGRAAVERAEKVVAAGQDAD